MWRQEPFTREDVLEKTIPMFWKHGYAEAQAGDSVVVSVARGQPNHRSKSSFCSIEDSIAATEDA